MPIDQYHASTESAFIAMAMDPSFITPLPLAIGHAVTARFMEIAIPIDNVRSAPEVVHSIHVSFHCIYYLESRMRVVFESDARLLSLWSCVMPIDRRASACWQSVSLSFNI